MTMLIRQLWARFRTNVFCLVRLFTAVKTGKIWRMEVQRIRYADDGPAPVVYIGAVYVPRGQKWPSGEGIERVTFYGCRLA